MLNKNIVCRTSGVYSEDLTRGKTYQVIDIKIDEDMVRLKCDDGRLKWFPLYHFNKNGEAVVDLISLMMTLQMTLKRQIG